MGNVCVAHLPGKRKWLCTKTVLHVTVLVSFFVKTSFTFTCENIRVRIFSPFVETQGGRGKK